MAAYVADTLLIGMCIQSFSSQGFADSSRTFAWSALLALVVYIVLYRPRIEIFDEGIRIHNPLTTTDVGWQDVDVVEAKYSAFLQLRDRKQISIWCAPTPGRYHSRTIHASEIKGLNLDGYIRPGESPRTDSGVVTYLCRDRLNAYRASGRIDGLTYRRLVMRNLITAFAAILFIIIALEVFHA